MAYATFSNITTGTQNSNATSTVVPIGFPLYGGESLLLFITKDGTGTFTVPAGWTSLYNVAYSAQCFGVFLYREENPTSALTSVTVTHAAESTSWILCRIPNLLRAFLTSATGSSNQPNSPSLSQPYGSTVEMTYIAAAGWDYNRTVSTYPSNCPNNRTSAISTTTGGTGTVIATANVTGSSFDPSNFGISSTDTWNAVTVGLVIGAVPVRVQKKTVSASSITFSTSELASRSGDLVLVAIQSMNSSKIYAPSTDWVLFSTAESGYTVTSHFYIRSNGSLPESIFTATGSPEMSAIWYRIHGATLAKSKEERIIGGTTSSSPYGVSTSLPSTTTITCVSVASSEPYVAVVTHPANMTDIEHSCFAETQSTSNGALAVTGAFDVSNYFAPGNYAYSSMVDFCGIAALFHLGNDPEYIYGDFCGYSEYASSTYQTSTTAPCPSTADPEGKLLMLISLYYSSTGATSFTEPDGWTLILNERGYHGGQRFIVAWKNSTGYDVDVSFTHDSARSNVMVFALVGVSNIGSANYRTEYNNYIYPTYYLQTESPFENRAAIHLAWRIWISSADATDLTNFTDNVHYKSQTYNRMHACTRNGLALLTADATSGMQTTVSSKTYVIMTSVCLECATSYNRTITMPPIPVNFEALVPIVGLSGDYSGGSGTEVDPFVLSTPADLVFLGDNALERADCFVLLNDIDMEGISFGGIGTLDYPFRGRIDGNGYAIKNLTVASTTENSGFINVAEANLFDYVVKDLSFENSSVTSSAGITGIVFGYAKNISGILAENVHCKNSLLSAYGKVGGVVGNLITETGNPAVPEIKGCRFNGTVISYANDVGGIAGLITCNGGTVSGCVVDVDLVLTGTTYINRAGGIAGSATGLSLLSNNIADTRTDLTGVQSANSLGGIVGEFSGASAQTPATAQKCVGKISSSRIYSTDVGGIFGYCSSTEIDSCVGIVDIVAGSELGGIVGEFRPSGDTPRRITNCISFGDIIPNGIIIQPSVGGIAGYGTEWPVEDSVSFCSIDKTNYSDTARTGGVLGRTFNMFGYMCVDVHYSTTDSPDILNVAGGAYPYTGSGETRTDLTYPAKAGLYDGWDFSTKWYWTSLAGSYPRLYGATFVEGETANSSSLLEAPQIITAVNASVASATQEANANAIAPSPKGTANVSGLQFEATSSVPTHSLLAAYLASPSVAQAVSYFNSCVFSETASRSASTSIANGSFQLPAYYGNGYAQPPAMNSTGIIQSPDLLVMNIVVKAAPACSAGSYVNTPSFYRTANVDSAVLISGAANLLVPDLKYSKNIYSPTAQAIAQCKEPTVIRSSSITPEQIFAYANMVSHSISIGATIVSISPDSSATSNVPLIALGRIMEAEGIVATAYFQEVEYLLDNNVFSDLFAANASAQARVLINGWDIDTKDNAGWTTDGADNTAWDEDPGESASWNVDSTEENIWVVDGIASNGWGE